MSLFPDKGDCVKVTFSSHFPDYEFEVIISGVCRNERLGTYALITEPKTRVIGGKSITLHHLTGSIWADGEAEWYATALELDTTKHVEESVSYRMANPPVIVVPASA